MVKSNKASKMAAEAATNSEKNSDTCLRQLQTEPKMNDRIFT
jgi:hypothetical protein